MLIDNLSDLGGPKLDSTLPPQQDPLFRSSGMASQATLQQSHAQHMASPVVEMKPAEEAQQELAEATSIRAALRTSIDLSSLCVLGKVTACQGDTCTSRDRVDDWIWGANEQ